MTSRSTASRTGTPKKLLVMPRIWRRGTPGWAPSDSRVAAGPVPALDARLSICLGQLNHAVLYRRLIHLVNARDRQAHVTGSLHDVSIQNIEELTRGEKEYAAVGDSLTQRLVTGHETISSGAERRSEHHVVLRVAGDAGDLDCDRLDRGINAQRVQRVGNRRRG